MPALGQVLGDKTMDQAEMAFVVTRNQCNLKIKTKNKARWEVFIRLLTQCYGRGASQGSILLGFLKQLEVVCLQWLDRSWSHLRTGGLSGEPLLIVLVLPCGAGTYQSFIILFYLFIYQMLAIPQALCFWEKHGEGQRGVKSTGRSIRAQVCRRARTVKQEDGCR